MGSPPYPGCSVPPGATTTVERPVRDGMNALALPCDATRSAISALEAVTGVPASFPRGTAG
jgi:hypothetical protein